MIILISLKDPSTSWYGWIRMDRSLKLGGCLLTWSWKVHLTIMAVINLQRHTIFFEYGVSSTVTSGSCSVSGSGSHVNFQISNLGSSMGLYTALQLQQYSTIVTKHPAS